MPQTNDIASTQAGTELDNSLSVLTKPSQDTDGADNEWESPNWQKWNGYYRTNRGGTKAAVDKFAMWAVGKGFKKINKKTKEIIKKINGIGKDSFISIMKNQIRVKKINGDSFAEIITKDNEELKEDGSNLINLKPLNPGKTKIITDVRGIIKKYEYTQLSRKVKSFEPEQIFHLINEREADEIHGISVYEGTENKLDKIQQLDNDMSTVFHRYVMPLMIFKLLTDDPAEITAFKRKADKVINEGQNLYVPKDVVDPDTFNIPQFATIDPMKWKESWNQDSIEDIGIPELVLGVATNTTEASAKIVQLSFGQTIEDEQRELEEQIELQLHLKIEFEDPPKIEDSLKEDEAKDGKNNFQPKDTKINMDGKK